MDADSDFYDDEINTLESRVATFDPAFFWRNHQKPVIMASQKIKSEEETPPPSMAAPTTQQQLYNPYEGMFACAKQLNESVDDFLSRLRPATTDIAPHLPWIYVANPCIPREHHGGDEEAPAEFGSELGDFVKGGRQRLQMLTDQQNEAKLIAAKAIRNPGRPKGPTKMALAKELAAEKAECVNDILMLAQVRRVRTGKWMLFIEPTRVNDVWATVARATVKNELGVAAKVAPREERGSTKERLICIYTYDFGDRDDMARVLAKMKQLGLVRAGPRDRQIYYKTDAFTHLGIAGGNPWGLKASMHSSNEIFAYIQSIGGNIPASKMKVEAKEEPRDVKTVDVKKEEDDEMDWTF